MIKTYIICDFCKHNESFWESSRWNRVNDKDMCPGCSVSLLSNRNPAVFKVKRISGPDAILLCLGVLSVILLYTCLASVY